MSSAKKRGLDVEWLLLDNGSLRPESTRALRAVAWALGERLGAPVSPVSLLHSGKVPAAQLDGCPAETLVPALRRRLRAGRRDFRILPFFFGPSRALSGYLPEKIGALRAEDPDWARADIRVAPSLFDLEGGAGDDRLARALLDRVTACRESLGWERPAVVLVDHGSPERAVTVVRDRVGTQLESLLGASCRAFSVASMERRPGPEYDFNEPLLERALRDSVIATGPVVVALMFLGPGRHAGPGGDVARIAASAEADLPQLTVARTDTLGAHPLIIDILAERAGSLENAVVAG